MNKLLKLEKKRIALKRQIIQQLKTEVIRILDDTVSGYDKIELTQRAFSKKEVSNRDVEKVLSVISMLRNEFDEERIDKLVVCMERVYRWAIDGDVVNYTRKNIQNGGDKWIRAARRLKTASEVYQLETSPEEVLKIEMDAFTNKLNSTQQIE